MTEQKRRVAVIGGGITGLTAAFYLQQQAKIKKLPLEIVLIESSHRLGGKIQTLHKDGFIIERGPDSFMDLGQVVTTLAEELGIKNQLIHNQTGQSFIAVNDNLFPVPIDSVFGIPTKIMPFAKSELISWSGKVRVACDLILPRFRAQEDQPLGKFLRRRFGKEVVETVIEPLLSEIQFGDIDQISLQATFPKFAELEKEYRSLIVGMKKETPNRTMNLSEGEKPAIFQSFKNGMETLVNALESHLSNVTILKGVKVDAIDKAYEQAFLSLNNKSSIIADAIIVTTPHRVTENLFAKHGILKNLQEIPAKTVATVSMAFPLNALKRPFDGTDFAVSSNSDYSITSCSVSQRKWPMTAPKGYALLKSYVGRNGDEAIVELSDSEIEKGVLQDLTKALKIQGQPIFTVVSRWKEAMPQYIVGHVGRVKAAKQELQQYFPTVKLAGNSYEGISIPDCVKQAHDVVEEIMTELNE